MWISTQDKESKDYIVWFNGMPVSTQLVGFDKLFNSDVAYWGQVAFLVAVRMPEQNLDIFDDKPVSPRAVISMRHGIIQWSRISELPEFQD